jgi:hypothetical protein
MSLAKYHAAFSIPLLIYFAVGRIDLTGFFKNLFFYRPHEMFGFGLTYWTNWMLSPPQNPDAYVQASIILGIVLSLISIHTMSRFSFDGSPRDLTVSIFMMVTAVLLSYRYVGEESFLWFLPFLTLMVAQGALSKWLYASLSLMAFAYAQKDFPYYLLPLATLDENMLIPLFQWVDPLLLGAWFRIRSSAGILAFLGTVFSILMLLKYLAIAARASQRFQRMFFPRKGYGLTLRRTRGHRSYWGFKPYSSPALHYSLTVLKQWLTSLQSTLTICLS